MSKLRRLSNISWKCFPLSLYPLIVPKKPRSIQFEITTKCNLACPMCLRRVYRDFKPNQDLSLNLFKKVIDDALPELRTVYLWGVGEPFLNKNFIEMIKYAKDHKLKVIINTNGTLINKKHIHETLIMMQVDELIYSIDATGRVLFDLIREGKHPQTNFYNMCMGIYNLEKMKKQHESKKPKLFSNFVLLKDNIHESISMIYFAKSLGIEEIKYQNVVSWDNHTFNQSILNQDLNYMNDTIFRTIKHLAKKHKIKVDFPNLEIKGKPKCKMPFFGPPNVRVDGKVVACCFITYPFKMKFVCQNGKIARKTMLHEPIIVGDVTKQTIKEMWNNNIYKQLRESYNRGKLMNPCDICLSQYRVIC